MSNSAFLYETNDSYRSATNAAIAANREKGMLARFPHKDVLIFLEANSYNSFYGSLLGSIKKYGKLSDKQLACARKGMAKEQEKASKEATEKEAFDKKVEGLTLHLLQVQKRSKGVAYLSTSRYRTPVLVELKSNTARAGDWIDVWANEDFSLVVTKDKIRRLGDYDYYYVPLNK